MILHPDYEPARPLTAGDIALIKLDEPAVINPKVQTIALAGALPEERVIATIAGWGDDETRDAGLLQAGTVALETADEDCTEWPDEICTETSPGRASICNGDSGGPLLSYGTDPDRRPTSVLAEQLGVTKRAGCGSRSVFTRVPYYVDWIEEQIGEPLVGATRMYRSGGPDSKGTLVLSCANSAYLTAAADVPGIRMTLNCDSGPSHAWCNPGKENDIHPQLFLSVNGRRMSAGDLQILGSRGYALPGSYRYSARRGDVVEWTCSFRSDPNAIPGMSTP